MDMAENGSDDRPSPPTDKKAGTMTPLPTKNETSIILQMRKEAVTIPEKPTNPKRKGSLNPTVPATPNPKCSSPDMDNKNEEEVSLFVEYLSLDHFCNTLLDDGKMMLGHYER